MNPELKIYNAVRKVLVDAYGNNNVWTYNPPEGTDYPFVRIAEQFKQNRRLHKQDLNGDTQVTVHFWHDNARERGTLTKMMSDTESAIIDRFGVRGEEINTRVMEDNSTSVTLLHGVLEINIKRYKN